MSLDFDDYIPTMVCTNHQSFVPCRHYGLNDPCHYTSDAATVELVRKHQSKETNND